MTGLFQLFLLHKRERERKSYRLKRMELIPGSSLACCLARIELVMDFIFSSLLASISYYDIITIMLLKIATNEQTIGTSELPMI